mmetsp:Transcript_28979/g.55507  ORF Transcript_28979/g.55507 Transcript_28979/m.55507 type:complete len:236 (-) Transcript_28979:53-760(-)
MRGFSIRRFMRPGATTSLLNITPFSTRQSWMSPPGIFSTLAYFLMSMSSLPPPTSTVTQFTASRASSDMRLPNRCVNLVPIQLLTMFSICWRSLTSIGNAISSRMSMASWSALVYPRTTTVGWMRFSMNGCARCIISPARIMTEVVPSPTSSSCVRERSIIAFAAGWTTSISRRIAFPSFVSTMPPCASRSIFSMDRGPSVVRMMSATALAAAMFPSWAFLPVSRLVLFWSTKTG